MKPMWSSTSHETARFKARATARYNPSNPEEAEVFPMGYRCGQ